MPLDRTAYYADASTPLSIATITAQMADAEADEFEKREIHTYVWSNSTQRGAQAGMIEGDRGYQLDTNVLYTYDGSGWYVFNSILGYASVTANQGSITAETDLTGLSVTVTCAASRRIRITLRTQVYSSVAGDNVGVRIKEGTTTLDDVNVTAVQANTQLLCYVQAVVTPTAGAHTYKASVRRSTGTGSITNLAATTAPAFILVEDIGAA